MDTNQLKRFAQEARNILKRGIAQRLLTLGFDADGNAIEQPVAASGGAIFHGETMSEGVYRRWMALQDAIRCHGVKYVYEEVAYTWFNRFVAIRIMEKNGFTQPMLPFESEAVRVPLIVSQAKSGHYPVMKEEERKQLEVMIDDESRESELFALLVNAQCHNIPIISKIFGRVNDYSELLLPKNILAENGFIDTLNHTPFITGEDYLKPELIGWLYQFYISEKKDEVFASFKNKKKAESEDIPAATQIFTPNWIVKYMVQNTLGRIYFDNNPYSDLKEKLSYLVESGEPTPEEAIFRYDDLHQLTTADLSCGSGHILNECFDLLYDIYLEEGYSRREAISDIFRYNLLGIDLDTRAKQLAQFALMMKACQKSPDFIDAHLLPRVLDMSGIPVMHEGLERELSDVLVCRDKKILDELTDCFELLQQAENLGSIMKFDISSETRHVIYRFVEEVEAMEESPSYAESYLPAFRLILALTDKYAVVDMNPPYMGSGNMNGELAKYVKDKYEEGKADLMTVFMQVSENRLLDNGKLGMINLPSWLFLSTFEKLRKNLLKNNHIDSLLHMGRGIFGIDWGSTTFVLTKNCYNAKGSYFRLHQRNFQHIYYYHIEQLFLKANENHCFKYDFAEYRDEGGIDKDIQFVSKESGEHLFYSADQKNFETIPGNPIGYWVSEKMMRIFQYEYIAKYGISDGQNITGDNAKYIRLIWEVSQKKSGKGNVWVPMAKGGDFRRWYGNISEVVNWSSEARLEYKNNPIARIQAEYLWYRIGITWNLVSSSGSSFRLLTDNVLFNKAAPTIVLKNDKLDMTGYLLGFLNAKLTKSILSMLNPTINTNIAEVFVLPLKVSNQYEIDKIVQVCISISKQDWDSHETSWDFLENPLIKARRDFLYDEDIKFATVISEDDVVINEDKEKEIDYKLAFANQIGVAYNMYTDTWFQNFMRLHHNEEELNRQFIEIYDLADELTPDVPLDEITILQQGEISIKDNRLKWNPNVVMNQFISYAIGCMMGRYRLDKPGLHIAYPNPSAEDIASYSYQANEFCIDDDGIIPLMPKDCAFEDNALNRFIDFVKLVFGNEYLTQNLNFLESSIGKTLEQYFVKDFWKDHVKMYQKRPIYWLFSSSKGAFQCLAYMHRMNPYTVEKVRTQYLLRHIQFLTGKIADWEANVASLSTIQLRDLDNKRKALQECLDYDMQLKEVADSQIVFDLDDGFVVNYAKFGDVVAKVK